MNSNEALSSLVHQLLDMDIDLRGGEVDGPDQVIVKSVTKIGGKLVAVMSDYTVHEITFTKLA